MPSSLIQQNHGESIDGHGYSIWDMKTCKYKHVEIPNDYSHYTIDIEDGKLVTDISNLKGNPRLRIRCKKSIATEVKAVVTDIRKVCSPSEISFVRLDADTVVDENIIPDVDIDNIADVDYQNKLIHEYILEVYPDIDKTSMQDILDLNKKMNEELLATQIPTVGVKWVPKKFEFSNMFSYGENNVIDFDKLDGVIGVFGPNYLGKSSIFSALTFCLFDKCDKTFKANQVMNIDKMSMSSKFTFEINSIPYTIERTGTRDKKGNVPVKVVFKKIEDGKETVLDGESRDKTNEVIRNYVGSYEDFNLTTLSIQNSKSKNIVEMGQTERKDLLSRFIGIDIFEKLNEIAGDKIKETSAKLKAFQKDLFEKNLAQLENEKELREQKTADIKDRMRVFELSIENVKYEILEKTKSLTPLKDVPTNINDLLERKKSLQDEIVETKKKITLVQERLEKVRAEIDPINKSLESKEFSNIVDRYNEYQKNKTLLAKADSTLENLKFVVKNKLEKLKHLSEHKYDPNCKFCCDNVFVKDAVKTKDSLTEDKQKVSDLLKEFQRIESLIDPTVETIYKKFRDLSNKSMELIKDESKLSNLLVGLTSVDKAVELNKVENSIKLYYESEEVIKENKIIESEIKTLKTKLTNVEFEAKSLEKENVQNLSRLTSINDQIVDITDRIEVATKLESEYAAYQAYQVAIGKDGVPYKMVSSVLPSVEREVNNILNQVCEFTMKIESEGSNVNLYICHSDRSWPIELTSGMEKFISSFALRVALINISSLPHPPLLVVDEGFGTLSAENLAVMPILFSFLKAQFDTIFVISHLDQMRDFVDSVIEIKKVGNFSSVDFK